MSEAPEPKFYAWANDADRVDAFAAAVSALVEPGGLCKVHLFTVGVRDNLCLYEISVTELLSLVRASFTTKSTVEVYVPVLKRSGSHINFSVRCRGAALRARVFVEHLVATSGYTYLCLPWIQVASPDGERSIEVESTILSMRNQGDLEDLLERFCAPDATKRVPTGGYTESLHWNAPLEISATYNADGNIARDLALSWLHIHDGDWVGYIAGTPLDALKERVEAAPKGATVGIAIELYRVNEHVGLDYQAAHHPATRGTHIGAVRRVPRDRLPGDVDLTREQVLKVMETPPNTLLEALEAAAVPDDEWRAVEPLALENLAAKEQGAPVVEVDVTGKKHRHFIEQHAPYHVRRLQNGGVMLATHPYRTLWPLWADALDLLGIRKNQ
ncbi:MAG: hypothetical protein HUU21_19565 [Polyangiaceae bacterium]|nr:hypothetical protein [Polyangiaceae bacterium]